MVMVYQKILFDGLVLKWVLHLIQIGQQEQLLMVVIQIVQYFVQLNVIQQFKIKIDGFMYEEISKLLENYLFFFGYYRPM